MTFAGFPVGPVKSTPLPNIFFTELLPKIETAGELKIILHVFWLLYQKKGFPRFVTLRELTSHGPLLDGLDLPGQQGEAALRAGLDRAVERGVLLYLRAELRGIEQDLYLVNTERSRAVIAKLRSGELDLGQVVLDEHIAITEATQNNVFQLYEENIGLLTPLIAEELTEAEKVYPASWIEDAFRQAVEYNRRNWRYIRGILERWAVEGKGNRNEEHRGGTGRLREGKAKYFGWSPSSRR